MAEFKLGRIRFVWKGEWIAATTYYKDDVVRYGGRTYICQIGHVSDSNFNVDLNFVPTKWNQLTDGQDWQGDWSTSTFYKINDIVKYGGLLYIANTAHTSAATSTLGLEADQAKWTLYAEGFDWKNTWNIATRYKVNDIVRYGGYTYLCNTGHVSASTLALGLEDDQDKWDTFNPGIEYKSLWSDASVRYKVNDVVKYGAGLWICVTEHTSAGTFESQESNWEYFVKGFEFESEWNVSAVYQPGDVVRYGGNQYISTSNHSGEAPTGGSGDWNLFTEGFNFQSDWSHTVSYRIGDVVRLNGYTYIAIADSPSTSYTVTASSASSPYVFTTSSTTGMSAGMSVKFSGTVFGTVSDSATYYIKTVENATTFTICTVPGGTTFVPTTATGTMTAVVSAVPPNLTYWERLNSGINWRSEWRDDQEYRAGDIARYGSNTYICINAHRSEEDDGSTIRSEGGGEINSRPDLDATGLFWNILTIGTETSVLSVKGDLVYFGGAGPTRLPIGREGQLLRAGAEYPEWVTLGEVDHLYFVATHGTDLPAPVWGKTWDKPWKTIRYACEQVENGPRFPNAKRLLELNRVFIQREVTEWVDYQIANDISPFTTSFDYDEHKCERDTGLIVDAVMYDLSHGGNIKSRGAALSYVNALIDSPGTYLNLVSEADEDVAAFNYMLTVVEAVLDQQAPAVNYQVLNGDNSTSVVSQYFESDIEAEAGAMTVINSLVGIITDAIIEGDADNIPARVSPNNLIRVATGRYREVLPIIVPENTCVQGDELRSTNSGPREGTTAIADAKYSIGALGRFEDLVYDITVGNPVTPTTGNSQTQSIEWPFAEVEDGETAQTLVRAIQTNIDFRLGTLVLSSSADPTNYNTTYLVGYGDARNNLIKNKKFIQEEVTAYINTNYPTLKFSRTACKRDVGYIVDAMVYDLTYGGNAQSVTAGLAYYEGTAGSLIISASEINATVDAYGFLKSLMQGVSRSETQIPLQNTVTQYVGTAGSVAASTFISNNMNTLIAIVEGGPTATYTLTDPSTAWVSGALTSAYSTLSAQIETIKQNTIDYINANFGDFQYDSAKCRRDLDIILDGIYYDIAFNFDFNSYINGNTYLRASARNVIEGQLAATVGALRHAKEQTALALASDATAVSRSNTLFDVIITILETNNPGSSDITWLLDTNAGSQLAINLEFIKAEIISWINTSYPSLVFDENFCRRDISLIVLGLGYDLIFGGDSATIRSAEEYFENAVSVLPEAQREITAQAFERLQGILGDIILGLPVVKTGSYPETQDTSTYPVAGSAEADEIAGLMQYIIDSIRNNSTSSLPSPTYPSISTASAGIQAALANLVSEQTAIIASTIQFIADNYNSFTYNQAKCSRDVGIILKAVGYDFMFDSNFQSTKAGYSYLRSSATEVFSLGQKTVTRQALEYVRTQAIANVGGDTTAIARINALMELIDDIIYTGSNEGSPCATERRTLDYAVLQLERNREFIVAEIDAWIADSYSDTVTATTNSNNRLTISDTSWLQRDAAIRFTGTPTGGLSTGVTYYVQDVINSTEFTVSTEPNSLAPLGLLDGSDSFGVELFYNSELCLRDVNAYINAIKYDLKYPGNYKSLFAARYYANSVVGSLEEDMFYLRDGTGIRDQTLEGLTGDLTPENEYGTSRVTAGAYCSLDPGWGPDDFRTWIINRSPYVQGITTIGTGAIGQKIDGALHNGGNDSIVSNDFTQVISDGIGAWVANNGRAELVSVFTYYAHIGYLCTEGGRIRGTNGNNSYGDFGSVAEGFDATETPNTAVVNNHAFEATVGSVFTNGNQFLGFEFDNAGSDYSEATWTLTGGGLGAVALQDEFRDDAVFQVRLLDLGDDSSGQFGGEGFLTNSNTAQGGTTTSISLAATDESLSTDYVGMKVYITAGTGAGQFGIIDTYNAGTKVASVVTYTGAAGWNHVVEGTTIVSPDASSTYLIEPAISFSAPGFSDADGTLPASSTWHDVIYGDTTSVHTAITGQYSGNGASGATFNVVRNGWKYIVTQVSAGSGYERLETITISGTALGGTTPANNLVITITSVNSVTGAIVDFESEGYGFGGVFVASPGSNTSSAAYSLNGLSWTASTLPTSQVWTGLAHGLIEDGSTVAKIGRFVMIAATDVTPGPAAAYSDDGINWTASSLPPADGKQWTAVAYGNGRFVAVNGTDGSVAISFDGVEWDRTATASGAFIDITYGLGLFAAIRDNSDVVATSPDGINWTDRVLPASSGWRSISWGNGKFVAVADDSNSGAYSLNGTTWTTMSIGSADGSSIGGYQRVRYGQGLFMATAYISGEAGEGYSYVMTSDDGVYWAAKGVREYRNPGNGGYKAVCFGNPQRTGYWIVLETVSSNRAVRIRTGARARGRAYVADELIFAIRITEPGSGYDSVPTMTVTDPTNIYDPPHVIRIGKAALATPTFLNRGNQYATGSAEIDIGDGFADFFQPGGTVAVKWITQRPVAGSNVVFSHLPNRTFKLVSVITFLGQNDGSYTAFYQISPTLTISEAPDHLTAVTTRIRYSQVRLTGHDFLDIGTGNFEETNYPGLPTQDPIPANETVDNNGGRVFFTSTDQDGNFRVGDLFAIEQSTGVATLNADAFNISGLQELNLGNVTLGGGSATITEFSTDPFFTADSDNVVPTQRAIKAYISAQIGGGGASLNVNSVTAGQIFISSNVITTVTDVPIKMNATFDFRGGVTGLPLAFNFFLT